MKIAVMIFSLLLTCVVDAQDCGGFGDCEFIRGDANCDGSVNNADISAIDSPTNDDAADVNDDGTVNNSDAVYLALYLFSSGPAPAAPYSGSGLDCTGDGLETCCSPPSSRTDPSIGTHDGTIFTSDWDDDNEGLGSSVESFNNQSCSHSDSTSTAYFDADTTDSTGFTFYRLDSGVQNIVIEIDVYATFEVGSVCETYDCPEDFNLLAVGFNNAQLLVHYTQGTSTDTLTIEAYELSDMFFNYHREEIAGECEIVLDSSTGQSINDTFYIGQLMANNMTENCDEAEITSVELSPVELEFTSDLQGDDVAGTESIQCSADFDVSYTWCSN